MFWSCWDTPQEGTIHQSNMIGANSQVLFKTSSTLNLTTPSGLVVDGETRLYFIDAKSGVIAVCETDKKSCKLLIDNAKFNKYLGQQQFYGLSVFKVSILNCSNTNVLLEFDFKKLMYKFKIIKKNTS